MEGGFIFTIKDLQKLYGIDNYKSAARQHMAVRDSLNKKGTKITIKEFCACEDLDFTDVWEFLRGKKNK